MPSEPKRLRVVERLAYKMYDGSDTGGIPWLRRGWTTMVAEQPERKPAQAMPGGEGMGGMGDMDF